MNVILNITKVILNVQKIKAIKCLDYLEKKHLEFAERLENKVSSWKDDGPKSLALEIADCHRVFSDHMTIIKSLLVTKRKNG